MTPEQDWLLRTASLYRMPVSDDGLRAIAMDQPDYVDHRRRLVDYSLLEGGFDPLVELGYFAAPGVVKELLGEGGFNEAELKGLHRAMANYHQFQGSHVSRRWADNLEAIYHFRLAGDHGPADELAEGVCGYYYRVSNFADANKLAEEIVERSSPPAPWWALNRYGQCQLVLGFPESALRALERALPAAPTERDQGATLNNISQIYDARGDYETALKYLEQSLRIRKEIGDKAGMIPTLHNMAHIALGAKDPQRAVDLWSEALSLATETGNAEGTFHVAWALGSTLAQIGEKQEGRKLLELAVEVGLKVGFPEVGQVQTMLRSMG